MNDEDRRIDLDRVGAVASFACAVHCAAIPILLGLGAAGAVSWLDQRPVEWGIAGLAAVVGTVSAWRGYRVHGNKTVALVLAAAALSLAFVLLAHHDHAAHEGEMKWVFPLIGLVVAVSHLVNRRLCKSCRTCDAHEHAPAPARERA
jgi:peptidoglycan/LPS O-acetylase OafA/YrhL